MLVKVTNFKLVYDHTQEHFEKKLEKVLNIKEKNKIVEYKILKQSIDARKKYQIQKIYTVEVLVDGQCFVDGKNITLTTKVKSYKIPKVTSKPSISPVIIGTGPAGLFCGLILAEAGLKPIIFERGGDVDQRIKDTKLFFESGVLNPNSNIQFGEGGAGTFSDGKLSSGVKDKFRRKEKILSTFVEGGAPQEIMYVNKPHIGTDYLVKVVKNIRQKIESLGGEIHFNKTFVGYEASEDCNKIVLIKDNSTNDVAQIKTNELILAIGHSARDTFELLNEQSFPMEQKAFAMGLRIEHPQEIINYSQYGKEADMDHLPVADYKLTCKTKHNRSVYSFCMCPGGYVVNSSSEPGHLVCNGMSNFKRDAKNGNAAILVNVKPEDFGSDYVLAGIDFQRKWERKAFEITGGTYDIPVQYFGDFFKDIKTERLDTVTPNIKGNYQLANLNDCLPRFVTVAIKEGILEFGRKIQGFDKADAVLCGIETRSSSPVRLTRDENFQSPIKGIYPCGEGAGYAGGIMSASIDGIKVAETIVSKYMEH